MSAEEWRPVVGNSWYRVSSLGRVLSTAPRKGNRTPRMLRPGYVTAGYPTVVIVSPTEPKRTRYIHHLVAEAFIGPRPEGMEIRHLDGDPANCVVANLRYGTTSENAYDRVRHGTHVNSRKTECIHGHPLSGRNLRVHGSTGERICRACKAEAQRRYRHRLALRAAGITTERAA